MAKVKIKKPIEYKTILPRPKGFAPKGEIIGTQFVLKPVEKVDMKKGK